MFLNGIYICLSCSVGFRGMFEGSVHARWSHHAILENLLKGKIFFHQTSMRNELSKTSLYEAPKNHSVLGNFPHLLGPSEIN